MLERIRNSILYIKGDREGFFAMAQERLLKWAIKYFKDKKMDDRKFVMNFFYSGKNCLLEFNPK